jgi:hypothetical protein
LAAARRPAGATAAARGQRRGGNAEHAEAERQAGGTAPKCVR